MPAALQDVVQRTKHVVHVLLGNDVWRRKQLRCETVRLGSENAQWCIAAGTLDKSSVVYSFGIGEDISFDLDLIERYGVEVHGFDPTPRSMQWLRSRKLPEKFHFHEVGIAACDATLEFRPPLNPSHVSYTLVNRESSGAPVQVPVRRLSSIMKMLRHDSIDILKMDIEGAEYDVISDIVVNRTPVRQLLVEFHHRWAEIGSRRTKEAIRQLNHAGYRIFDISATGAEYSFIRT